jgi:hypothetical protein
MPALVTNYQKKVLETRIKKFYSVIQQAQNMTKAEGLTVPGSFQGTDKADDPESSLEFFDEYLKPYVKTTEVKKLNRGIAAGFPDGSGMYLRNYNNTTYVQIHTVFCVDYKECKGDRFDMSTNYRPPTDGKTSFAFWGIAGADVNPGRNNLLNYCTSCRKTSAATACIWCTPLLLVDGWEIKDDYPW